VHAGERSHGGGTPRRLRRFGRAGERARRAVRRLGSLELQHAQPSLTRKKLRRLELLAGAQKGEVRPGIWAANKAMRKAERELAEQAERAYERSVRDWQATKGASATPGRAFSRPLGGKQRGKASVPDPAL
jgi:hypothetical protein